MSDLPNFKELRHDPDHHLGLGDVRITVAQQDAIDAQIERLEATVDRLEAELKDTVPIEYHDALVQGWCELSNGWQQMVSDRNNHIEQLESAMKGQNEYPNTLRDLETELLVRAYEHGQDDASEGRPYIPHLYSDVEAQAAYQKGWKDITGR